MAESLQQKCSNCKKMGMIRCDGCSQRFCSTHFNEHRHHLDALFERVCNDRDSLCEQISDTHSASSSNHPQLNLLLDEVNEWEQKTLKMVRVTADHVRQQVNELMNSNKNIAKAKLDEFSKELRKRKEEDDYFEQDIERLSKRLEQIQIDLKVQINPSIRINVTTIDWSKVVQVVTEKSKVHVMRPQQNQLFVGGTLLTIEHQIQLNQFFGNENQKWQLIYKASRNGFNSKICHQCCDKQGPTLTVIQSVEGYLFGGYTSVAWNSGSNWQTDKRAFLFTLTNPHNIPPTKYLINSKGQNAIWPGSATGPTFGCYDIYVYLEERQNYESFSEFPKDYIDSTGKGNLTFTGSRNFAVIDIEMYRFAAI